jgi:hypothetical protein
MAINKFIIIRNDLETDPVTIETEGLTIGRLTGNELVLNHKAVSRTHAGIKEIKGAFWIFNLSHANGTMLNGDLVEDVPLADGDLIQIGPFLLRPTYIPDGLTLTVEMSVNPLPLVAGATGALQSTGALQGTGEIGKTIMLDRSLLPQREKPKPARTTKRLTSMGVHTGDLEEPDARALKVFWDNRKREAGKLEAGSPLRPKKGQRRLGKARFNWRPTGDLERSWSVSILVWSFLLVGALAAAATFIFKDAYSPGELSAAHVRNDLLLTPALARAPSAASCTTCHSAQATMQQNCAACHTTPAFHPSLSAKHTAVGLACTACHTEHQGRDFKPAQVASNGCVTCHHDGSFSHGKQLRTPHGGTLGYPLTNGNWTWAGVTQTAWERKGLPRAAMQYELSEQFHLVHLAGQPQGRANCSDCHTAGFEGEAVRQGVRESCATCHSLSYQVASDKKAASGCVACHAQHGEEKELRASRRRTELAAEGSTTKAVQ